MGRVESSACMKVVDVCTVYTPSGNADIGFRVCNFWRLVSEREGATAGLA